MLKIKFICKRCKSKNFRIEEREFGKSKTLSRSLYCADCGTFHKYLKKDEIVEHIPKTNREVLSSLSNRHLAEVLAINKKGCSFCTQTHSFSCRKKDCRVHILNWLNAQAEPVDEQGV